MEPTINYGDLLLLDTRVNAIKDDSIYILQTDHHLIVKRVQLSLDGSLLIISDNKRYATQTLSADQAKDVKVVGRLRWYGHEI
jgi:phage repressor protein C with HTH and peptisase S24 domain